MHRGLGLGILATVSALAFGTVAQAGVISGAIDNNKLVTLTNNTRPEANALNDRGRVDDKMRFGGLELILRRSADQETAFRKLIDDMHDPRSPSFHHWISNAEAGKKFGLGEGDMGKITGWLSSNGFKVKATSPDHTFISFSGNAGQISKAFHTEIHLLSVNGVSHFANMSNPKIPAALKSAVAGVIQLHDFYPHPMYQKRVRAKGIVSNGTETAGCYPLNPSNTAQSFTSRCFMVTPGDLATIYNMAPTFASGIAGTGQTIVVVEDTNVYKPADWNIFRNVMKLNSYTHATFTQVHPTGAATCTNPGVNGDDGEAILDAEYASASAPDANIVLASCSDIGNAGNGFGGLFAIQNLLAQANPPKIISMSYGECETLDGAASNASYNNAAQLAASEGVSLYVSSGDESATSCDANATRATRGIGVSGFQSSPYNISVGGTDYSDTTDRTNSTKWQTYWNDSALAANGYASAKSYIPEVPWNNSCASEIMATFYTGSSLTYGTSGFCNNTLATTGSRFLTTGSGSGGPSGCATGSTAVANSGVVSGTCAGWAKPTYQSGHIGGLAGLTSDGVRDTPDVSLFAANGVWGHFFPFCDSDPADAPGAPYSLSGCQTNNPFNWAGAGGTSFSAPIWAGIQALINQKSGQSWGNTNTQFYALGAAEYGAAGNASCNSNLGAGEASNCVFNDVTSGDFNVNCRAKTGTAAGLHNCYLPSGTNGVGTTDLTNSSYAPMYKSGNGWDFTTGLGTPNVNNLVNAFAVN